MKKIDLETLIDYFTGSLSKNVAEQVELWSNKNVENKKYFDEIKNIWNTPNIYFPKPNTEDALNNVLSRIENGKRNANIFQIDQNKKTKSY